MLNIVDTGTNRIYEIPFSKSVFAEMMKHTNNGQVALGLSHLRTGKHYGVSMEDFLTDNVPALIERYSKPAEKIDINNLLETMEKRAAEKSKKIAEEANQYG